MAEGREDIVEAGKEAQATDEETPRVFWDDLMDEADELYYALLVSNAGRSRRDAPKAMAGA